MGRILFSYVVVALTLSYLPCPQFRLRPARQTNMNVQSSRSHSVMTVTFTQTRKNGKSSSDITSKINLIDLAGSERLHKTKVRTACGVDMCVHVGACACG